MNLKSTFNSRHFKYGVVAMLVSVLFVIMVIVLNLIITALDDKYNLKYDMTSSGVFTITDATKTALDGITTEVSIKFLQPRDKLAESDTGKYILECAESYAQEFKNVKLEYIDMIRYPTQVNKYRENGLSTSSVIVESPLRYTVIPVQSFFVINSDYNTVVGFNGEMRFTSAILQTTNPTQPVVTFTQNHGETVPAAMQEVFTNAGFVVEKKDISSGPINPDTKIIVINNPTTDFFGLNSAKEGGVSEIEILNDFMNDFGHVMVFLSADNTAQLPELEELLASRGVRVNRGSKIKDLGAALDVDGYMSVATPVGEMYGSTLTDNVTGRTIVTNAAPIDILFTDKETSEDGSFVYIYDNTYVDPVLATTNSAVASLPDETEVSGPFYTMVLSSKFQYVDNQKTYSHMLVASTDSFANFIGSNAYGNEKLLYNAMSIMGQQKVPVDIEYKLFDNASLEKIEQSDTRRWAFFLIGAIPLAVAACGMVVWLKRRHR